MSNTQIGSISFESTKGLHSYAKQNYATLSRMQSAETNIEQNATSITSLATMNSTYTDPNGNTVENKAKSYVDQTAQGITQNISRDYATKTELNGAIGEFEAPYTEVEWVESNGTQYVYLDWKPNVATWGFEADFIIKNTFSTTVGAWNENTNINGYGNVFGVRNSSSTNDMQLGSFVVNGGGLRIGGGNIGTAPIMKIDGTRQTVSFIGTTLIKGNGTTQTLIRATETANKYYANMTVFAMHEGLRRSGTGNLVQPGSIRIYSLKFYNGTEVVVDLVGAIRNRDGMTGLYDKVKGHFYPAPNMTYGNATGVLGEPDTIAQTLAKRNISVLVDNRAANNSRMWYAKVPDLDRLEDGQQITVTTMANIGGSKPELTDLELYWDETRNNSNAPASVYLKLELADGSTTEWIPCYYAAGTRLTSHYNSGVPVLLTYREDVFYGASTTSAGTSVMRGFWADPNYYTNDIDNRLIYFSGKTGSKGIWANSLFMEDGVGTYQNICTASDGTVTSNNRTNATTKIANTNGFKVGGPVYYTNTTYAANTNITGWGVIYSGYANLIDARYSFNATLTNNFFTPYTPIYLVGTIDSTDGLYYLDSIWWTQTPNDPNKVYVLVGGIYDSTTSNCRFVFYENNPWYVYDSNTNKLVALNQTVTTFSNKYNTLVDTVDEHTTKVGTFEAQINGHYAIENSGISAGTAAKAATITPTVNNWTLYSGATVAVKFLTANTATTPTLNINGTGAKTILAYNGATLNAGEYGWAANSVIPFVYNGTNWLMQDSGAMKRLTSAETTIQQTANNVLIKATENDTTAAQSGQHLIESFINVAPSGVTISADKVNIEGATIFTGNGRLSQTSLNNAYDAKGAASTAEQNSKSYTDTNAAPKTSAVSRTQRIYYRQTANGAKPGINETWLATSGTGYGNWSLTIPQLTNGTTKYPKLYTAVQTQTVAQQANNGTTCSCSPVQLDDSTTIIDGGNIITGTIDANAINADTINGSSLTISSFKDSNNYLNSNIQVGGRNLIRYSNQFRQGGVASSSTMTQTVENGLYKMVISGANNNWNSGWYAVQPDNWALAENELSEGDIFTISFTMRSDDSTSKPTIYIKSGLGYFDLNGTMSTKWSTLWYTGTWKDAETINPHLGWSGKANGTYYIKNWKLEKGNVPTAWSEAPEDTEENINNIAQTWFANCTTAAATAAKTATIDPATENFILTPGATVNVKFTNTNSAAVNNLTLSVNNTTAKSIKYIYNNSIANIPAAGYLIAGGTYQFVYDGTYWQIQNMNYNTNDNTVALYTKYYNTIVAGDTITAESIIGGRTDGKFYQIKENSSFDLAHPLLWTTVALNTGGTNYNSIYTQCFDRNLATFYTSFVANTANQNKIVYLVGTVNGNTFTTYGSNSSQYLTCTPPTTEDGRFYIPIGRLGNQSNGKNYFNYQVGVPITLYAYVDGKFRQVTPTEIVATHRIYYRTATANNNLTAPTTTWIEEATVNVYDAWTTKIPPLASGTNSSVSGYTKYLYLYTCEQRKRLDGTIECTKVLLDENTTVIDGGNIITNSITANALNATNINASNMLTIGAFNSNTQNSILNSEVMDKLVSRGEQLIINGSAFMGDNTNFSSWTYDGTKANVSGGSFTRTNTLGATPILNDFIPIDASQAYEISFDALSAEGNAKLYCCLMCYDIDENNINSDKVLFVAGSTTTLAQDLKAGDTYVYLTNVSGFDNGPNGSNINQAYSRKIIFWDYTNSKGYTYPQETYSRHITATNLWADHSSIDYTNNRIALRTAWSGTTIPAGTPLSQGNSGATYEYVAAGNATIPTTWKNYKGYARPKGMTVPSGTNVIFRAGTAKVKIGFLWNYGATTSAPQSQIWITNVSMMMRRITSSETIEQTQQIYYRSSSSSAPSGAGLPTTWITATGDLFATTNTDASKWSLKASRLTADANGTGTKYPYLWTCTQKKTLDGTVSYGTIALDDTTTVIDGGKIITGSVQANAIKADSGTFNTANIPNLSAAKITSGDIAAARIQANAVSAINATANKIDAKNINVSAINIGDLAGEIGGRNLLYKTNWSSNIISNFNTDSASKAYGGSIGNWYIENTVTCTVSNGYLSITTTTNGRYGIKQDLILEPGNYIFSIESDGNGCYAAIGASQWPSTNIISNTNTGIQSVKFTVESTATYCVYLYANASGYGTTKFKNVKLEKGSRATDWTPAPEDVEDAIDDASQIASNYIHADSTGINIYDSSLANASKYYLRQTAGGTYIYRNSYLKAKYEDTITLYGGSNANGANPKVELTPDNFNIYDKNGKKRTAIDTNGLHIFDASSTPVEVALFGSTVGTTGTTAFARIGKSDSSRFEISPTTLSAYTGNTKYFEVSANGLSWGSSNTAATTTQVSESNNAANTIVTVYPTAIDYAAGTATLAVKCMRGTTAITPSAWKWTKGTSTDSIGTNSTLQVTDLNAVYNCTVTIAV